MTFSMDIKLPEWHVWEDGVPAEPGVFDRELRPCPGGCGRPIEWNRRGFMGHDCKPPYTGDDVSKPANDYFPRPFGPFAPGYVAPKPNTVVCIVCQQNVGTDKFDIEVHRKAHLDRESDKAGFIRDKDEAIKQAKKVSDALVKIEEVLDEALYA